MVQWLGKRIKIWSLLMNNPPLFFLLTICGLLPSWVYAIEGCSDEISHQVETKTENGEPISMLSIKYNEEVESFTVPFTSENSSCKKVSNNGIIKISVVADRPNVSAVYYFDMTEKINYIGSASIFTSAGEERVSGIGEINKGNDITKINLEGVADEDSVIISKIIDVPYIHVNSEVPDLYSKMRYIEIDELSESTGSKICDSGDRVFYYCKTTSGRYLNLCYSPFSGDITYAYGKQKKEISLNDYSLVDNRFIFKNKNTSYNVSPEKGEISVTQNGKELAVISCR